MPSPRQALLDELVAERYARVHRTSPRALAAAADTPAVLAERQRVLNAALDGSHLVAVDSAAEVAA